MIFETYLLTTKSGLLNPIQDWPTYFWFRKAPMVYGFLCKTKFRFDIN